MEWREEDRKQNNETEVSAYWVQVKDDGALSWSQGGKNMEMVKVKVRDRSWGKGKRDKGNTY